ncbi:DNA primase [Amycolatopsis sp. WAC 04182]|uniref:bifunctional DNA primase/polymerase n=1 Tax=Amycolatopsis TaxID=1813 RepID=UPI00087C5CA2|nr:MULTISPECIES: bifunctional DNA primase/polymerase [Amycolatopsis]RSN60538.1 DNA primase [Amycolatopsis sp. WAC 04182]SDU67035.1 Bifunctional DNA primase/polymerase, N-terminal [Amycolatopsis keratiniphila]
MTVTTTPESSSLVLPTALTLHDSALEAIQRGWRVFPQAPRSKRPAITRWEQRATLEPDTIHRWWTRFPDSNVGIACGPSGLLVLDLDAAHGPVPDQWANLGVAHGRDVIALLAARARQRDPVDTLIVATPRGEHRYFRRPPGTTLRSTIGDRGRGLGWRADTRGPGAAVTAPGSIGRNGLPYTIVRDLPIADLPGWLVAALTPPPPPPRPPHAPVLAATSRRVVAYVNAAVSAESRNVATAEKGQRHITLYAAAAALGELLANGWITDHAITHHLTEAARRHLGIADFTWNELTSTIRDGIAKGRRTRRVLSDRPYTPRH